MNWKRIRTIPWIDTRARFVARVPVGGRLVDFGSSDGETLRHMAELRPDLQFFAVDLQGVPEAYPPGCEFHRANVERDSLPWPEGSMDAVTCMHLVEHLDDLGGFIRKVAGVLKRGGTVYFETPHPKTLVLPSPRGAALGQFTLNFYDNLTHTRLVPVGVLAHFATRAGLEITGSGTSRNWLFAAAWPFYMWRRSSRQKYTALAHWVGWSAYLEARKP